MGIEMGREMGIERENNKSEMGRERERERDYVVVVERNNKKIEKK